MSVGELAALFLAATAILDLVLGVFVIEPRVPEEKRPLIRKVFLASTALMLVLATAFWFGIIPPG